MGQCPGEALYCHVFARMALFMEHAFKCAGVGILSYEVAQHRIRWRD